MTTRGQPERRNGGGAVTAREQVAEAEPLRWYDRGGGCRIAYFGSRGDVFVREPIGGLTDWMLSGQTGGREARCIIDLDHDPTDAECRRWLAYCERVAAQARADAPAVLMTGGAQNSETDDGREVDGAEFVAYARRRLAAQKEIP